MHARESANELRKKFATDKVDDVGWMTWSRIKEKLGRGADGRGDGVAVRTCG